MRLRNKIPKVLIVGGSGYIAGRLAQYLENNGKRVVLGSRNASSPPKWLNKAEMVQLVWEDDAALMRACKDIDVIVHAAGVNAQDCTKDPVSALRFNGVETARLINAASLAGVDRFIYLSTAHVYASPLVGAITEETCPRNLHPYATSHLAGEQAVLYAGQAGSIESLVLRLSNSVGAPMHKSANCWGLVANDLSREAIEKQSLTLHSPVNQQRDFVPMSEVCRVIDWFVSNELGQDQTKLFNLGSGVSLSLLELASIIQNRCEVLFGFAPNIDVKSKNADAADLIYRIEKLESQGLKVRTDLTLEVDKLLQFCKREFGMH